MTKHPSPVEEGAPTPPPSPTGPVVAAQAAAVAPLRKPLTMKVIGVGGAGCNVLGHLAPAALPGVSFLAMNTDAKALDGCPVPAKFVLGAHVTCGLGAGGDPERGHLAAEDDREALAQFCAGADVVIILAGLGGGTGTGASPVLAEVARKGGALVLGLVVLPFDCEGPRRQRQALLGLQKLKEAADAVICLPNQKLLVMVPEKATVLESLAIAHELLARGVRAFWRVLTQPGLINVDFADVCTVTRERHAECALVTAEAQGENRSRELIEKILDHPLLEEGRALADASAVLVSLVGGPDLSLADVNGFMEQVNRHCENAHIIMGAAIEDDFTGRLSATVLASRRPGREKAEPIAESESAGPGTPLMDPEFLQALPPGRLAARHVAPPPVITADNAQQMLQNLPLRARKKAIKMVQGQLALDIVSRGRFEKSEPTIRSGQDLDVPTYIRRNLVFN